MSDKLSENEIALCIWAANYGKENCGDSLLTPKVEMALNSIVSQGSCEQIGNISLIASVFFSELKNFIYFLNFVYRDVPQHGFPSIEEFYKYLENKGIIDGNSKLNLSYIHSEDSIEEIVCEFQKTIQFNNDFVEAMNSFISLRNTGSLLHKRVSMLFKP